MIKGDNYLFFPANVERRISRLQIITEYYSTYTGWPNSPWVLQR